MDYTRRLCRGNGIGTVCSRLIAAVFYSGTCTLSTEQVRHRAAFFERVGRSYFFLAKVDVNLGAIENISSHTKTDRHDANSAD